MTVSCEERERKEVISIGKKRLTGPSLTSLFLTYFDLKRTKRRLNIKKIMWHSSRHVMWFYYKLLILYR